MSYHQGYGNDGAFERFRQERQRRRQQRLEVNPAGGFVACNDAQREIAAGESREAREQQLHREMFEFVRETTRIAATVIGEVATEQTRSLEHQVDDEMNEFFQAALHEAEELVEVLRTGYEPTSADTAELETRLAKFESAAELMDPVSFVVEERIEERSQTILDASDVSDEDMAAFRAAGEAETVGTAPPAGVLQPGHYLDEPLEIAGPVAGARGVPESLARLLDDPRRAKKALSVLVRANLLTVADARSVLDEITQSEDQVQVRRPITTGSA